MMQTIHAAETQAELAEAQAEIQAASAAAEAAVEYADELRARLRSGDDRVTPTLLVKADADLERTALLLKAAEAKPEKVTRLAPKSLDYAEAIRAALQAGGLPVEVRHQRPGAAEPQHPHLVVTPATHAYRCTRTGRIYGEVHLDWVKGAFGADLDGRRIEDALRAADVQVSGALHLRSTQLGQDVRLGKEPSNRPGPDQWGAFPAELVIDEGRMSTFHQTADAVLGHILRASGSTLVMSDRAGGLVGIPALRLYGVDGRLRERTVEAGRVISVLDLVGMFGQGDSTIDTSRLDTALPARADALVGRPVEGAGRIVSVTDVQARPVDAAGSQRGWTIPSGSIPLPTARRALRDRAPRALSMTVTIEALAA